jgi:hypothetical protein
MISDWHGVIERHMLKSFAAALTEGSSGRHRGHLATPIRKQQPLAAMVRLSGYKCLT